MNASCANCRFWRRGYRDDELDWETCERTADGRAIIGTKVKIGACQREPAHIVRYQDDWCGEHESEDGTGKFEK